MNIVRFEKRVEKVRKKTQKFEKWIFHFWELGDQIKNSSGWPKDIPNDIKKLVNETKNIIFEIAREIIKEIERIMSITTDIGLSKQLVKELNEIKEEIKVELFGIKIFLIYGFGNQKIKGVSYDRTE